MVTEGNRGQNGNRSDTIITDSVWDLRQPHFTWWQRQSPQRLHLQLPRRHAEAIVRWSRGGQYILIQGTKSTSRIDFIDHKQWALSESFLLWLRSNGRRMYAHASCQISRLFTARTNRSHAPSYIYCKYVMDICHIQVLAEFLSRSVWSRGLPSDHTDLERNEAKTCMWHNVHYVFVISYGSQR